MSQNMEENMETYLDPHDMNLQCQFMNYAELLDENESENSTATGKISRRFFPVENRVPIPAIT